MTQDSLRHRVLERTASRQCAPACSNHPGCPPCRDSWAFALASSHSLNHSVSKGIFLFLKPTMVTHCCQCLENLNIWKKILETILNGSQDARCVALRKISSQMIPHGMPSFPWGCPDSGPTICHHCFSSMWMNCHAMGWCSHGYATLGESGNLPSTEISHPSNHPVWVTHIHTHKQRNTQIT